MRLITAIALLAAAAHAHVPLYCTETCCTPKHHYTTSQAVYKRGTGGFEIKLGSQKKELFIDYDVVMRETYDHSTYALHVGCGTCTAQPQEVTDKVYKKPTLEPFTQTAYYGLFEGTDRPKFNATECTNFAIFITDHNNRTNNKPLIWSAVVGRGESFTAEELILFPLYIQHNHGYYWTQRGYILGIVAVLSIVLAAAFVYADFRWAITPRDARRLQFTRAQTTRAYLYAFAVLAYCISWGDAIVHIVYITARNALPAGSLVTAALIAGISHGMPVAITVLTWRAMYSTNYIGHSAKWAPLEIAVAVSWFFFFGSGLWVGPAAILAASLVRTADAISKWQGGTQMQKKHHNFYPL